MSDIFDEVEDLLKAHCAIPMRDVEGKPRTWLLEEGRLYRLYKANEDNPNKPGSPILCHLEQCAAKWRWENGVFTCHHTPVAVLRGALARVSTARIPDVQFFEETQYIAISD